MRLFLGFITIFCLLSCVNRPPKTPRNKKKKNSDETVNVSKKVENGDTRLDLYLPILKGKNVGVIANQSSIIGQTHLIDTLLNSGIAIKRIFAPEHGIRGNADAGEKVNSDVDTKTGISIVSLYGNNKKPSPKDLEGLDVIVFDLQDVGVRFYTYISTMHLAMEACAEQKIPIIILDRPNPNGNYIAGPILDLKYKSFIGMHPIPIVHGLTVGELAQMINGEKWLTDSLQTDLTVIACKDYTHDSILPLAVKPSPNLTNLNAIRWYPSICLFEETQVSVGRGTLNPFEIFGSPYLPVSEYSFTFTPKSIDGMSKTPPFQDQICYGKSLIDTINKGSIDYNLIVNAYKSYSGKKPFFTSKNFTQKLCGGTWLIDALEKGYTVEKIESLANEDIKKYKLMRAKYLIYPDFIN